MYQRNPIQGQRSLLKITELKVFTEFCYLSSTLTMNKRQKILKDQHVFWGASKQVSISEARQMASKHDPI